MPAAASVSYPSTAIDTFIAAIQFDAQGLVPAIAQQHDTGEVLMVAWMNRDAVAGQCARAAPVTGRARARRCGARAKARARSRRSTTCALDCDGDTVLLLVDQPGVACHTGRRNCFFRAMRDGALETITPVMIDMDKIGKDWV